MTENNHPLREDEAQDTLKPKKPDLSQSNLSPIYNESLMEIFGFTESTLNNNRSGFVTRDQKALLQGDLKNDADAMWLMLTIMLATSVVLGLIMTSRGIPMMYLVIGAGVVLLPMLWYAYRQQNRTRSDLENLRVKSVQGKADVFWRGNGTYRQAWLRVHDKFFKIGLHEGMALEEYDISQLRVYYTEHSRTILAAEVVPLKNSDRLKVEDVAAEDEDMLLEAGQDLNQRERSENQ